jgi:conjugative transfer pilus assembly protein TraH
MTILGIPARHPITLALILVLACARPAQADMDSDLGSFFDGMNFSNVTPAGAYEGQSAGYYTGGSAFLRVPQRNYTLFSVQWPKVRAGCGGIDLFSGGFSFINSQALVDMLRNIGEVAITQAFMLALKVISPQIADTMGELQSWAQKFNNMNINSCEAGQQLVGGALEFFGQESGTCLVERVNTYGDSYADAKIACGAGGELESTLNTARNNNSDASKLMITEGNIAWKALMKNSFFANDTDLAEVVMNLSGTLVVKKTDPGTPDTTTLRSVKPSILLDGSGNGFIEILLKGGTASIDGCADGTSENQCLAFAAKEVTIGTGLIDKTRTILDRIQGKIVSDAALDAEEIGLLESTALPVQKYLTVGQAYFSNAAMSDIDIYATLIAKDILYTYLNDLLGKMATSAKALQLRQDDNIQDFHTSIVQARAEIRRYRDDTQERFDEALAFTEKTRTYEKALASRLSPGLFRTLSWSAAQ